MEMEEFTIEQDYGPDIVFQGELLVRSERACPQPSALGRWYDISVFRRSDGMWVVQRDFKTLCLHERPRTEIEIVDRPDDVALVLASHEATEYLNRRWVRPRHQNEKQRFFKTLVTNYDSQVDIVSMAMAPYVEEYNARAPTSPDRVPRGRWRGLLKMVGIQRSSQQSDHDLAATDPASSTARERSDS